MTENNNDNQEPGQSEASAPQAADTAPPAAETEPAPAWESKLDSYPARPEGKQDPRWALNLFWIWATFTVAAIIFMTVLIVLGFWYD